MNMRTQGHTRIHEIQEMYSFWNKIISYKHIFFRIKNAYFKKKIFYLVLYKCTLLLMSTFSTLVKKAFQLFWWKNYFNSLHTVGKIIYKHQHALSPTNISKQYISIIYCNKKKKFSTIIQLYRMGLSPKTYLLSTMYSLESENYFSLVLLESWIVHSKLKDYKVPELKKTVLH